MLTPSEKRLAAIQANARYQRLEVDPFGARAGMADAPRKRGARMPFGKYKRKHVSEVPEGYLRFVIEKCQRPAWLIGAVKIELERRERVAKTRGHQNRDIELVNRMLMEI